MENEVETPEIETPETPVAEPAAEEKPAKAKKPRAKREKKVEKKAFVPWNTGKTMELHGCRVSGKNYPSVWAAFQAVFGKESPDCTRRGRHIAFRGALKQAGVGKSLDYTKVDGKKVKFTLIPRA